MTVLWGGIDLVLLFWWWWWYGSNNGVGSCTGIELVVFRFWLLALQQSHSSSSDGVAVVALLQYCCFGGVVVVQIMERDHVLRLKWLCWECGSCSIVILCDDVHLIIMQW